MSPMLPAFQRATRVAEALFSGADASVVLVDGERVWRSGGSLGGAGQPAIGARYVIDRGKAFWVADREPDSANDGQRPRARFWAGAPLRLADGAIVGVLAVMSPTPRAYDKTLAARLQDLADGLADECERARFAETVDQRDRELRQARKVMSAFVSSVPIGSVMTDRDLRVLTATPAGVDGCHRSPGGRA
jgi:GAF domain-containing protein